MESRGILSKKELGQAEEDIEKQETIGTQQSELPVQNKFRRQFYQATTSIEPDELN